MAVMKAQTTKVHTTRPTATVEVLIVGGGVIGSSIAYHVARQGRTVLVVERNEVAAQPAASWASAGGIRPQGLHPALAREAHARWPRISEELEADLHYRKAGHLLLAESEEEAEQLQSFVQRQNDLGFADISFLDRKTVRSLMPTLGEHIVAGSFSPTSGHADPRRTTRAFAAAAQRQGAIYWAGIECLALCQTDDRVVGALTKRGIIQAEQTVLAAGAWSRELAHSIGIQLPLRIHVLQV
ncbi:MAG: FAD-binding oxidoreductase, partial [Ktedonobacteraceae bacterium]|nr:FAD-binding oxidoreductase [Ktedonobacteraceae bacterium]